MVLYQCPRCHYETNHKNDMRKHYIRKRKCDPIYSDIKLNKNEIKSFIIKKDSVEDTAAEIEDLRKELDEKNKQISELITKVGNNNNNTINIHIHDFNNTNYNIALEDLKQSIKQSLLKNGGRNMNIECENLVELIHCNPDYPENQNILITDRTRGEAKVKKGDHLVNVPMDDAIDQTTERIVDMLKENHLFGRYLNYHEQKDEEALREDKKAVERTLYNNRHMVADTLRDNNIR